MKRRNQPYADTVAEVISLLMFAMAAPVALLAELAATKNAKGGTMVMFICCILVPVALMCSKWLRRTVTTLFDSVVFLVLLVLTVPFVFLMNGMRGVASYLVEKTAIFLKREAVLVWQ